MKCAALVLLATLAMGGTAHAQAWPNATPSPYGAPAAQYSAVAPARSAAVVSSPAVATGEGLGVAPHALGAAAPSGGTTSRAALPASGETPVADLDNPEGDRATAALNVLEAQGYASFSDFRPVGTKFTALVSDNGQKFRVLIDPDMGQISRQ
ncbi:MAG TPA: hypothetical protein VEU53_07095 [Stellaceae bacterium]|nr:hypothetical protein [Stellaceae bacterium]